MNATQLLAQFDRLSEAPGAVPRLRRFILDLAVRGKLVAQDAGDEPAAELLKRIRAEKEKPKKSRSISLAKNLEDDSMAAGYDLPPSWKWEELGHLVTTMDAGWSPQCESHPRRQREMWGVLKTTAVQPLAFDCTQHKELPEKFKPRPGYEAQVGDVLITRAGPKNRVGVSCVVDKTEPRLMISDKLIRFHLVSDINPFFCALALNAGYSNKCVEDAKSGMAVMQMNISQDRLKTVPLPIAPLAEQHRIVAKVDELMALCDQLEAAQQERERRRDRLGHASLQRLNQPSEATSPEIQRDHARFHLHHLPRLTTRPEHIKALRQTFFNLAVCGRLVAQDADNEPAVKLLKRLGVQAAKSQADANSPIIPATWAWVTIDQIAIVGSGTTPSRDVPDYFSPVGTPWVTSGETSNAFITQTAQHVSERAMKETSLKLYPSGTLIVAMYGQGKTRGQIAELSMAATTNQACAAIVLKLEDVAHRRYVKLYFQKIYEEIRELAAGGAQPNLNGGKIKSTLIPFPPLAEQHRIVAKVDELMALCDQLEAQLTTTQTDSRRLLEAILDAALVPI